MSLNFKKNKKIIKNTLKLFKAIKNHDKQTVLNLVNNRYINLYMVDKNGYTPISLARKNKILLIDLFSKKDEKKLDLVGRII